MKKKSKFTPIITLPIMDKQKLVQVIKQADMVEQLPLQELQEVAEEYPYFQTVHLLLAQKANSDLPQGDKQLKILSRSASFAANRERLYQLLQNAKQEANSGLPFDLISTSSITPPSGSSNNNYFSEEETVTTNEVDADVTTVLPPTDEHLIQKLNDIKEKSEIIPPIEKEEEEVSEKPQEDTGTNIDEEDAPAVIDTEKDILDVSNADRIDTGIITRTAIKEVEKELEEAQKEREQAKDTNSTNEEPGDTEKETLINEDSIKKDVEDDMKRLLREISLRREARKSIEESIRADEDLIKNIKERVSKIKEEKGFNKWLQKKGKVDNSASQEPELPSLKIDATDADAFKDFVAEFGEKSQDNKDIDSIDVNAEKEELTTEKPRIVSETFAKVQEVKGEFKEAIKIYERLSLKFPEKKTLFAAKIDELKKML